MNKLKILLFLLAGYTLLYAQEGISFPDTLHSVRVDSISIIGNEITEDFVILRELTFAPGDSIDWEILDYNRERVYSLGLFNHVSVVPDSINRNIINIAVEESWYIYPLPYFELRDRSWQKISYGFDVIIKNFRGRNETLRGRMTFGYDPSYYLFYDNPNLIQNENIFFSTSLSYRTSRNRSLTAEEIYGGDFDQKFIIGEVGLGKRLNLYNRVAISLYYVYVESPVYFPGISAAEDRIDRVPGIGVGYSYDTRDLVQFPSDGIYANINAQFKGLGLYDVSYQVYNLDFREYRNLFNTFTGKWRLSSRITSGDVPYYDYSFLGLGERIRGHFNEQYEGNNLYLGSLELFYPLIKEFKLNLDFVPLLPDQLLHYRFALYTQVFTDAGLIQQKEISVVKDDIHNGYGIGLTFLILPYSIMRLEYAIDEHQNGEFIFDLGISF
jgi:outer membrane protein assembly factor BamA